MVRIICPLIDNPINELNSTSHLIRQAAISPAVMMVQNPRCAGLFSTRAVITSPIKTKNMTAPTANARAARPNDGSSCSGLASGGPTARAPQDGQPRQRSTDTPEPQEGQIIKLRNLWRNK